MAKPRPSISERAADRVCPNCGGPVARRSSRGPMPTFCDAKGKDVCKGEHASRELTEGRAIIAMAKAWRGDRGSGEIAQSALKELCAILDSFNAADVAEKRPRADLLAAKRLVAGYRYMDRKNH